MSHLRSILIRLVRGALWPPGATAELPPRSSIVDDVDVEDALRYTVRAEVAGAAPPSDAWSRLQRRLKQGPPAGVEISPFPLPARSPVPPPRPWWLDTGILHGFHSW